MACGLNTRNLNLKPGQSIRVQGDVDPEAKGFSVNLGKDGDNLCLHFNPRINQYGVVNTIVCNSRIGGTWGEELRDCNFPFLPGTVMEVCISFDGAHLTIKLQDGYIIKFPNRLNLETINYLSVEGDVKVTCMAFD